MASFAPKLEVQLLQPQVYIGQCDLCNTTLSCSMPECRTPSSSSPTPKRIKSDSSPSPRTSTGPSEDPDHLTQPEPEPDHCAICLQPFIDRAIIPVCAHEFCFECILVWSDQSRKCPLCSRSFDDAYLIHRIRSQYDYQKHYLPPARSSTPPAPTPESRAALRHTRRQRQWGRRARREREEADELERAISRRRWIYQHDLYAKHVASNQFTRYRPFPAPAQFSASPDFIRRMTMFLRRELRIWPSLDVEFLTTYTIALMKSIDIRSESAVKLLSEFLDLDTPYTAGARHVNAEHFAHEIYSYLRSPYRDLNTYDKMAQYDIPPEISPPQEMERGSRWSLEHSPSRRSSSRSPSRHGPPHRDSAPATNQDHGGSSALNAYYDGGGRGYSCDPSPRESMSQEYDDPCNHSPNYTEVILLQAETSCSTAPAENEDDGNNEPTPRFRGDKKGKRKEHTRESKVVPPKVGARANVDMGDEDEEVDVGSSAKALRSRHHGLDDGRARHRTLSESVQAYLGTSSVAPRQSKTRSVPVQGTCAGGFTSAPSLLLRLVDGPAGPNVSDAPEHA